ncbi:MFS transporter [Actinomyces minihominis]|uniref:MFS transporter n=1 Tax=Actinomyces minihominis TaxID=2002838 RepID=UPI001A9294AA|nr:MFS transporter [Actinomyces minihominis]
MSVTTAPTPQVEKRESGKWIGLAVLMLPVLLVSIDGTVVNLALPQISRDFATSGTLLLWIIDAYSLVLAGLLVTMGSFADRFGRRKMLLIGGAGFALVSAAAAFAPSGEALVAIRILLGFFGAMLMPSTVALIRNMFTDRSERRLALAIWASCFSAGAALGPVLGGVLLQFFTWHAVFLLALPLLVPMLILTPLFVPESKDPNPGPISILNVVLSMLTLAPAIYAIKTIATEGATAAALTAVAVAIVSGLWFARRQLTSSNPMLDLHLFKVKSFSGAVLTNLAIVFAMVGFLYYSAQHLQLVEGLEPLFAGLVLLPGTIVMAISGLAVVPLARRYPINRIVAVGAWLAAVAYLCLMIFGVGATPVTIAVIFSVLALGTGAAETLTNDAIVSAVPAHKAGAASAISETAYEVGTVLGTAILGSISVAFYTHNVQVPGGLSPTAALEAGQTLGGAVNVASELPASASSSLLESAFAAFDSGVLAIGAVGAIIMAAAGVLAWVFLAQPAGVDEAVEIGIDVSS